MRNKKNIELEKDLYPTQSSSTQIKDVADVLRCQLPRKKISFNDLGIQELYIGELPSGDYIAQEICPEHFDPVTGFIPDRAECVNIEITEKNQRFLIIQNDILVNYMGVVKNLGITGFVPYPRDAKPLTSVTVRTMCIIRAHSVDPVWLYYRLREGDFKEWIEGKAKGATTSLVDMDVIKGFQFDMPNDREVAGVNENFKKVLEYDQNVKMFLKGIQEQQHAIHSMFAVKRQVEMMNMMAQKNIVMTAPADSTEKE